MAATLEVTFMPQIRKMYCPLVEYITLGWNCDISGLQLLFKLDALILHVPETNEFLSVWSNH